MGWLSRFEFAGTAGWALTDAGRAANERQLAEELARTDSGSTVRDAHAAFLPHNDRLLRACTDWQLRPTATDPLAANEHTDLAWDQLVLRALSTLSAELRTLGRALSGRLVRFAGYDERFRVALSRAEQGDRSWVARPRVDSCHTVWMELHEDLVATLGIQRGLIG